MKVFLLLAIVAFTGCQAKQPIDVIWVYWANAKGTAEETMKTIGEFKLVQEVNARFTEGANVAKTYADMLHEQVNPVVQDVITKINKEAEVLKLSLVEDLTTVRDKLEPYTGDIKAQIQEKVEELREAVAPYTKSLDIEALKTTVLQKTEEIRGSMEEKMKELQSELEPYTEELRKKADQHLLEFQNSVAPLTDDLQAKVAERAAMIQQSLAPYAEDLKEKLEPYTQTLNDHLISLYKSITKTE